MKKDRNEAEDLYDILDKLANAINEPLIDPLASMSKTITYIEALMFSAEYERALAILKPIMRQMTKFIKNENYSTHDMVLLLTKTADCYLALEEVEKGEKLFKKFAKQFSSNSRFWVSSAYFYLKINRPLKAITILDDVYEKGLVNGSIEVLSAITDIFQSDESIARHDDYKLLFKHVDRMVKRNPNDISTLDLLAFAHFQKGDYTLAQEMLRRLIIACPFDPQYHFKRAVIHEEQGKTALALISYSKAISLDEDDGEISDIAMQMIAAIDQRQLKKIAERAAIDHDFYMELKRNPEQTAIKNGYFLSPYGLQFLHSITISEQLN